MPNPYNIVQQQEQQHQNSQVSIPVINAAGTITLPLEDASNFSVMCNYYSANIASLISKYVKAFLPYSSQCEARQAIINLENKQMLLCIETWIRFNNNNNRTSIHGSKGVRTVIVFPRDFADKGLAAFVIPSLHLQERVKLNNPYVNSMGKVLVESLISSGLLTDPYNIEPLIRTLERVFTNNYPFEQSNTNASHTIMPNNNNNNNNNNYAVMYNNGTNNNHVTLSNAQDGQPRLTVQNDDLSSYIQNMNKALANDMITTRKSNLDSAAEKVVIDLNQKAKEYLTIRKQSLEYVEELLPIITQLSSAKEELEKSAVELKNYLPVNTSVANLIQQLDGRSDSIEEHEKCLVAENDLQAQELELTAELQASADALNLLEEGLKSEILTCDEYVKHISDIGREQFFTRFLQMRVVEKLAQSTNTTYDNSNANSINNTCTSNNVNSNDIAAAAADTSFNDKKNTNIKYDDKIDNVQEIPKKLSPISALEKTFPNINRAIISDVVDNLHGDVKLARLRLQSISSF